MSPRIPDNLRINADDFGLDPAISRAIFQAARDGLINSFSVVPFSETDQESQHLLAAACTLTGLHIGAHLTFVGVPLLTRPAHFSDGIPPADYRALVAAWAQGKVKPSAVRAEWSEQIALLQRRLGPARSIHHLDSHQHTHLLPGLWPVARALAQDHGIPNLRRPAEPTLRAWRKSFPLGAALQLLAFARPGAAHEAFAGVGTSMGFRAEAYAALARQIRAQPRRRFELMVHPGQDARGQRELDELERWLARL